MSLLDVLRGVMLDPAEQAAYNADPGAYLERYGYDDVDPADLSEAFGLVADTLPPDQAQAAWSAATDADDGSFGAVTADFDDEAGIAAADASDAAAPEGDGEPAPEPTLSFGEGDSGTSDIDDPSFDDGSPYEPDDTAGASGHAEADGGDGSGALEPEDVDDGLDGLVDHTDADVDGGFDDTDPDVDGGFDDTDDLPELDGLGGIDDPGPDDLDIGSF